jgi:hypothetical protein
MRGRRNGIRRLSRTSLRRNVTKRTLRMQVFVESGVSPKRRRTRVQIVTRLRRDSLLSKHSEDDSTVESSDDGLRFPAYNSTSLLGKRSVSVGASGDNELLATKNKQAKTTASSVAKTESPAALLGVRNSKSIGDGPAMSVVLAKDDEQKTQEERDREKFYNLKYLADVPTTDWRQWTDDFRAAMFDILVQEIFPYVKFVQSAEDLGEYGYMGMVFRSLGYGDEDDAKHVVFRLKHWMSISAYIKIKIGMLRNNIIGDCKKIIAGTESKLCVLGWSGD